MNNLSMQNIGYSSQINNHSQVSLNNVDPKNKLTKEERVTNKQDDNSYDETNSEKTDAGLEKENTNQEKFEYSDNGEFVNDTQLIDTNPNDEFL